MARDEKDEDMEGVFDIGDQVECDKKVEESGAENLKVLMKEDGVSCLKLPIIRVG